MMLQIGVGYAPRALRTLQGQQPSQGLTVVVASDDTTVTVSATAITIKVPASSAHAGSYPLALADLAHGPVCLVAPVIRDQGGVPVAEPGLWAYDAARGSATIARQWLSNGTVVAEQTGLFLVPVAGQAGHSIVHVETARQGEVETSSPSRAFILPEVAVHQPAKLNVTSNAMLELATGSADATTVKVIEPKAYAGSHTIRNSDLGNGPVWLLDPVTSMATDALPRAIVTATPGLFIHDADVGPVTEIGNWYRGDTAIAGATGLTYVVAEDDRGHVLSYRQVATNRAGSRMASSKPLPVLLTGVLPDTFTAENGTPITAYAGESGRSWDKFGSGSGGGKIQDGYLIGAGGFIFIKRSDDVSGGKYTVTAKMRSVLDKTQAGHWDRGLAPAVGIKATNTGIYFRNDTNSNVLMVRKNAAGTETTLKSKTGHIPVNTDYEVKLAVDGTTCIVWVNGVVVPELGFSDAALAEGASGVWGGAGGENHNKIDMFKVETA